MPCSGTLVAMDKPIGVTTSQGFEGWRITEYLGVVRGIVVRSPGIGRSFLGGLKSLVGGNIASYEAVCEEARQQAFQRMLDHALAGGANGIVAMHYDATEFMAGVTEVLCYGTAVKMVKQT
jgi:uncharacterized protein YbjQ (UPF0145 family)